MEPLPQPRLPEPPELVDALLTQDPDLAGSLARLNMDHAEIVRIAESRRTEIIRSATPEIEQLSIAEGQLASAEFRRRDGARLPGVRAIRNRWVVVAGAVLIVIASPVSSFVPAGTLRTVMTTIFLIAGVTVLTIAFARWRSQRRAKELSLDHEQADVDMLHNSARAARSAVLTALVDRGLRPIVLQATAKRADPDYTTRLEFVSSRGLSEIFDPTLLEVETPGVRRIREFLDHTPGGSIGLAGPRGTGKSTLMASFVDGRSRRTDNERGCAIQVSAPVEYDPREFILHVFATLCQSVLLPPPRPASMAEDWDRSRYGRSRGLIALLSIPVVCTVAGLAVLAPTVLGEVDWQMWGGIALVAIGVVVFGMIAVDRAVARRLNRARTAAERSLLRPRPGVPVETASQAADHLDRIRYQQTYRSGWSGSAKAGVGALEIAGGVTAEVARVRNTMSLPEIVCWFKEFVGVLTATGPVIIGIDELDKIATADRAQAFLNDIKSLFGVNQCYFLISISEDALAGFERRGLPLRDAFDSALDDVVRVGPLDYPTARKLIRQRVIGLSNPHAALAYCLAAGLPRDIIRWTRALLVAREPAGDGLEALARHVIGEDLRRKTLATTLTLSRTTSPADARALQVVGGLAPVPDPAWLIDNFTTHWGSTWSADDGRDPVLDEIVAYFYFCATVLEVFTDDLTEATFNGLVGVGNAPGGIEQLVHARQCFSSSPALAVRQVTAFRRERDLRCPAEPGAHGPAGRLEVGREAA